MPLSGAMAHFKGDIHKRNDWEWVDEVKNHETIKLGEFWDQAVAQTSGGLRTPVLHISSNYRPIITVIRRDQAQYCHDPVPRGMVVYCKVRGEDLVLMTIDTYMTLRKENL